MQQFWKAASLMVALLLMVACGAKSGEQNLPAGDPLPDDTAAQVQPVGCDRERDIPDEATYGGQRYRFAIHIAPADSLPTVMDRFGDPYKDNQVRLVIDREGQRLCQRSFTKRLFADVVPEKQLAKMIFGGMRFTAISSAGIEFAAQINLPGEEDGGQVFRLTFPLTGLGNPTIVRDNTQDVEREPIELNGAEDGEAQD